MNTEFHQVLTSGDGKFSLLDLISTTVASVVGFVGLAVIALSPVDNIIPELSQLHYKEIN